MKICDNLYALRTAKGLSQKKLAAKTGISVEQIEEWENGSAYPSIANLKALQHVYKCTTTDLANKAMTDYSDYRRSVDKDNLILKHKQDIKGIDHHRQLKRFRLLCGTLQVLATIAKIITRASFVLAVLGIGYLITTTPMINYSLFLGSIISPNAAFYLNLENYASLGEFKQILIAIVMAAFIALEALGASIAFDYLRRIFKNLRRGAVLLSLGNIRLFRKFSYCLLAMLVLRDVFPLIFRAFAGFQLGIRINPIYYICVLLLICAGRLLLQGTKLQQCRDKNIS